MVLKWDKDRVCLCEKCHLLCASAAEPSMETTPLCAHWECWHTDR